MAKLYFSYKDYKLTISKGALAISINRGTQGPQGPPGIPGPSGGQAIQRLAGQNLSSGRAVVLEGNLAYYFDPLDSAHIGRLVGVTLNAALTGDTVNIQIAGEVTDAAFAFTADAPVFVGAAGVLTSATPTAGIIQPIGVAVAANKVVLHVITPFLKN